MAPVQIVTLMKKLDRMRQDGLMCDLVLRLQDGTEYHTHRLLFCAMSTMAMETCANLGDDDDDEPTNTKAPWVLDFTGTDITPDIMENIISFVYGKDLLVTWDNIDRLLHIGELLGMKSLILACNNKKKTGIPEEGLTTLSKESDTSIEQDGSHLRKRKKDDDNEEWTMPIRIQADTFKKVAGRPKRNIKPAKKNFGEHTYLLGKEAMRRPRSAKSDNMVVDNTETFRHIFIQVEGTGIEADGVAGAADEQIVENTQETLNHVEQNTEIEDCRFNENVVTLVELQNVERENIVGDRKESTDTTSATEMSMEEAIDSVEKGATVNEVLIRAVEVDGGVVQMEQFESSTAETADGVKIIKVETAIIPPDIDDNQHTCEFCGMAFKEARYLKDHIKYKHAPSKSYLCEDCNKKFHRLDQFRDHMAIHLGTFRCEKCEKLFGRKRRLVDHQAKCQGIRQKTTSKRLQLCCYKCDKVFLSQTILDDHIQRMHQTDDGESNENASEDTPDGMHRCAKCKMLFNSERGLTVHLPTCNLAHTVSSPLQNPLIFKCDLCDNVFPDTAGLNSHMRYHVDQDKRTCPECGEVFARTDSLHNHMRHHTEELKCSICQQVFTRPCRYKQHMLEKHSDEVQCLCKSDDISLEESDGKETNEDNAQSYDNQHNDDANAKEYSPCLLHSLPPMPESQSEKRATKHGRKKLKIEHKCDECGKTFSHNRHLWQHKKVHENIKPYKCEIVGCNKAFINKARLQAHAETHSGEKKFQCLVCMKRFATEHYLKIHGGLHNNENVYMCEEPGCNKIFRLMASFKLHKATHGTVKPHTCIVCKKGFWQKVNMMQHMRVHTNEKPYKCQICDRAFKYQSQHKLHMRYHTGEGLRACDICDKLFINQASLAAHQLTHTGDRPFTCVVCGNAFGRKDNLLRHIAKCAPDTLIDSIGENMGVIVLPDDSDPDRIRLIDPNSTSGISIIQGLDTGEGSSAGDLQIQLVDVLSQNETNEAVQLLETVEENDISEENIVELDNNSQSIVLTQQDLESSESEPQIELSLGQDQNTDNQDGDVALPAGATLVKFDDSNNFYYIVMGNNEQVEHIEQTDQNVE